MQLGFSKYANIFIIAEKQYYIDEYVRALGSQAQEVVTVAALLFTPDTQPAKSLCKCSRYLYFFVFVKVHDRVTTKDVFLRLTGKKNR